MNDAQKLWWNQSLSDYKLFLALCDMGVNECHLLHYLQMATEKLSKAYLWRTGKAPPKTHAGLARFLRAVASERSDKPQIIAKAAGFTRTHDFEPWVKTVMPLVHALQNIAPAEAGDGPNPEYPWPHAKPKNCPCDHAFGLWRDLNSGPGRKLMIVINRLIHGFSVYC